MVQQWSSVIVARDTRVVDTWCESESANNNNNKLMIGEVAPHRSLPLALGCDGLGWWPGVYDEYKIQHHKCVYETKGYDQCNEL